METQGFGKLLIALAFIWLAAGISTPARAAECAIGSVQFQGASGTETDAACAGIAKVDAYFRAIGAEVPDFSVKFVFEDQVYLPASPFEDRVAVHGYFDTDDHSIHMTHFTAGSQQARTPWGQAWNNEIAASLLLHEITHLYAISYMKDSFRQLPHHWHEFLAYAVQLELMEPALRGKILGSATAASAFAAPAAVNPFFYEADPEKYAVNAHLSAQAWGGGKFIKELLDHKIPAAQE